MYDLIFISHIFCAVILTIAIIFCRTLHSVKQFVVSGISMRTSKFVFVRRIRIAWDAPRMKAYRNQLSEEAHVAQVRIQSLINE